MCLGAGAGGPITQVPGQPLHFKGKFSCCRGGCFQGGGFSSPEHGQGACTAAVIPRCPGTVSLFPLRMAQKGFP